MKKSKGRSGGPHPKKGDVSKEFDDDDDDEAAFRSARVMSGQIDLDDDDGEAPSQPGLKVIDFESRDMVQRAHDKVAGVLREGTISLPKAFSSNLARDRQNLKDGIAGGILGGVATFVSGDPIFFILAAPIGFIVRNVWNTARIRMRIGKLTKGDLKELASSDLPELKSAWDLTCYKFVRLVRGYNARVHVVHRIRESPNKEDEELLMIAGKWDRLLRDVYGRLGDVFAELQRHQELIGLNQHKDLEEVDDNLRHADLLGYFDGVPLLDWLDLDQDRILISQAKKVFRADDDARAELRDLYERRKESIRDLDDYLKGTDPVFDKLDREHGEAARAIQEADEDGNEDDDRS